MTLVFLKAVEKFVILGTFGMPAYDQQKRYYQLAENLMFIFIIQKLMFIPHLFLEILQRYYKLIILGTLGTPSHTHQNQ